METNVSTASIDDFFINVGISEYESLHFKADELAFNEYNEKYASLRDLYDKVIYGYSFNFLIECISSIYMVKFAKEIGNSFMIEYQISKFENYLQLFSNKRNCHKQTFFVYLIILYEEIVSESYHGTVVI